MKKLIFGLTLMLSTSALAGAPLVTGTTLEANCKFKSVGALKIKVNLATQHASVRPEDADSSFDAVDQNWMIVDAFTKQGQRKRSSIDHFEKGKGSRVYVGTVVMVGDNADDTDFQMVLHYTPCRQDEIQCSRPGLMVTYTVLPDSGIDGAESETSSDCTQVKISNRK